MLLNSFLHAYPDCPVFSARSISFIVDSSRTAYHAGLIFCSRHEARHLLQSAACGSHLLPQFETRTAAARPPKAVRSPRGDRSHH
jgi:hypothetical protein